MGLVVENAVRGSLGVYTPYLFMTEFPLISLKPKASPNWDAALRPFPLIGWAILALSIFLVAPVTWFVTKKHRELMNIVSVKDNNVWKYFGHATATLLVEPWPKPPGGPASIILATWLIACLVLQSIYSSNFAVSLRSVQLVTLLLILTQAN
jgi:hypothetical protein